jgi:hypothetical protein
MEQKMDHRYLCNNKEKFIKNLRLTNQRAEVESEIVDLIEAYARLRLDQGKEIRYYGNRINSKNKELQEFLDKNRHLDHRILNFLASYFLEMQKRSFRCVFTSSHLAHFLKISREQTRDLCTNALSKRGPEKNIGRSFTKGGIKFPR